MNKKMRGFTLVEVMIVAAIIAIISVIAYPSYMASVRKSNRAEAKTELMDVAQRLQRCYTAFGRYNPAAGKCAVYDQLTTGAAVIPSRGAGYYNITISNQGVATYTLTATAVLAPQISDTDGCHELKLTQTGVQTPAVCW